MRNLNGFGVCLLFLLFLGVSITSIAQTTGGSLIGRVVDDSGQPVAGASIEIRGSALQGVVRTATGLDGRFVFPFLPVGNDYEVKVEAEGFTTVLRRAIEIPLGVTVSLPFTIGSGRAEIVVTSTAPIVDSKQTEVGAEISERMTEAIPLPRKATDIAFLAPGAISSGLDNTPSIGGASGPENAYIVNGVDMTSSRNSLPLFTFNFDFIEATEVKTGGIDAEYGGFTGGMVNTVTKSGGNELHGSVFAYYYDDGLGAGERRLDNPSVIDYVKSFKQWDVGGSLAGYFVKDKLWFFVAYDYNRTETGHTANGTNPLLTLNGRPSTSWAKDTGYTEKDTDPQYALKLTWNAGLNHKVSLSLFGDDDKFHGVYNPANLLEAPTRYFYRTKTYNLSLQWNATWKPRFFTELILARRDSRYEENATDPVARNNWWYWYRFGPMFQVIPVGPPNAYDGQTRSIDLSAWEPSLGGDWEYHMRDINDQVRAKATILFDGAGRHELSFGLQRYDIHYDVSHLGPGPGFTELWPGNLFYGRTTSPGTLIRWQYSAASPSHYMFRASGNLDDQVKETRQTYTAYWIQDNWNLTDFFMVKLGLRLDQIHLRGGDQTLNVPDRIAPGKGYANGRARSLSINDEWAPRIGFTWDLAHNGKSKLYGFYGMYFERIPNDLAVRALTDEMLQLSWFFDAALSQPVPSDFYHNTYGLEATEITGGPAGQRLKGSYNEEWILGFQYEIRPDFSMGVRAAYRTLGRIIEDLSMDGGTGYIITNPGNWTGVWTPSPNADLGPPYDGYFYRFPKPVRIYKALEITANKRFSDHWLMQGSYVLSRLQGNYEGLYSNDNGQLDPNITTKYDLPQLLLNAYGLLPNDRTHVLKLYGGYFFSSIPLEVSAVFQLASGTPISKLGADDYYGPNEGFCAPRGTAGRTPTVWTFDLGVQYTFRIWRSNLGLRADIFNLTNEQRTTAVNQTFNTVDTSTHQNYPYFKMETAHQQARRIRLALRWTF